MTDFETRSADWLEWPRALEVILSELGRTSARSLPLLEAVGLACAEEVRAPVTLPPWPNSAMDGYAVRSEEVAGASPDSPRELRVVGAVHAGERFEATVGPGQAVRIMTGAPIPDGADGVIRVEDTDRESDQEGVVRVLSDRDRGRHIRPAGRDLVEGQLLLQPGEEIDPGTIGMLAAAGRSRVSAHDRPTFALVPTGDEIVGAEHFDRVRSGRAIPDSNGPVLSAAVEAAGGRALRFGPVADDPEALHAAIERAEREAAALVTIGGASMGEGDRVKTVLDARGFRLLFWRIRLRPGTPFGFGMLPVDSGEIPVFSLPGNPASAFVTFQLLVRPALRAMGGHRKIYRQTLRARALTALSGSADRVHAVRVRLLPEGEGRWGVRPTGPQNSGLVHPQGMADGLALVPPGEEGIAEGEDVEVVLLSGDREAVR